jgi:hypothetical protein
LEKDPTKQLLPMLLMLMTYQLELELGLLPILEKDPTKQLLPMLLMLM